MASQIRYFNFGQMLKQIESYSAATFRLFVLDKLKRISKGSLQVQDYDGSFYSFQESPVVDNGQVKQPSGCLQKVMLKITSPSFWMRVGLLGDVGFAQSFMLGEVMTEDLTSFFKLFILNRHIMDDGNSVINNVMNWTTRRLGQVNDIIQSSLNANLHYSLSNTMFAAFLSNDMTYSCPIWVNPNSNDETDTLEEAQLRKLRKVIRLARLNSTDHVLEIGSGWGSFAILATKETGCRVTTVTLSVEQKKLAEERIANAGLSDRVEVLLCDYRQIPFENRFDKIVSLEMIEHVGAAYLYTFFACIDRYLKPEGGIFVLQAITIPESRYRSYLKGQDFIQKYIFPGGHLPTVSGIVENISSASEGRMIVEEISSYSLHYAKALARWKENFLAEFDGTIAPALKIEHPEMTETDIAIFCRKWQYYFSYCEAGFRTKTLGDVIVVAGREGTLDFLNYPS